MNLTFDLTGKVAVVTGGGGILCGVMAKALAKSGAKVAILDLRQEAAQTVADEINAMVYEGSGAAEDVLEAAEAKLHAVRENRGSGGLKEIRHVMQNVFDAMSEAAASGSRIPGLSTGLPDLDDLILGLNKSELVCKRIGLRSKLLVHCYRLILCSDCRIVLSDDLILLSDILVVLIYPAV